MDRPLFRRLRGASGESLVSEYPETLREKQSRFALMVAQLILFAYSEGYEITLGHAERCEVCPVGLANSNHKVRLAIDLHLFRDGSYLRSTEDHRVLGEFWEDLARDARWGGRFGDGNHYSLEHHGVR